MATNVHVAPRWPGPSPQWGKWGCVKDDQESAEGRPRDNPHIKLNSAAVDENSRGAKEPNLSSTAGVEQAFLKNFPAFSHLDSENISGLRVAVEQELADSTRRIYLGHWKRFCDWYENQGYGTFPADPEHVSAFLNDRYVKQGQRPATLNTAAAAISFFHRAAGLENPCDSSLVRSTLKSTLRQTGSFQRQAKPLTAEFLTKILQTACIPRRGRGGHTESYKTAWSRGTTDIAIVSLMRDAMLRVSEAAALKWEDIESVADGTGRLIVRYSKTDPLGEGAVLFLSSQTMGALDLIRSGAADNDSVFRLRPNQISRRISQAAKSAGLGDGFSGHSPRVGMACDLARAGTELPSLMTAGRWSSPRMPALYTRGEAASRGAVARYYAICRKVSECTDEAYWNNTA